MSRLLEQILSDIRECQKVIGRYDRLKASEMVSKLAERYEPYLPTIRGRLSMYMTCGDDYIGDLTAIAESLTGLYKSRLKESRNIMVDPSGRAVKIS